MPKEEFNSNSDEDNTNLSSSIPNLFFYIIILLTSLLILIIIVFFIIRRVKQSKQKKTNDSLTPNIHFKTEEPPSVIIRNDQLASCKHPIDISSNIDKTTENRCIIESIPVIPPRLSNNPNSGDIEISKTFNSETYTDNEDNNETKKNEVVVITDITTKTTNM